MSDNNPTGFSYYGKTPSGVEMALTIPIPAIGDVSPEGIAAWCAALDGNLKKQGFTRSERLEKPAGGFGGGFPKKQETPPPDDLIVPEHCGLAMKFVAEREKDGGGKVGAHWDCRKGRGCDEAREVGGNKYPFTDWKLSKKVNAAANTPKPSGEMHYGQFLTEALRRGFNKLGVLELAQTDEPSLHAMGAAEWQKLLDRMQEPAPTGAGS